MSNRPTPSLSAAQHEPYDLVVIGAGPAGSTLAALAAQAGRRVLLLERDSFPRHKVCGEFLSPEARSSLAAAGLLPALHRLNPATLTGATLTTRRGAAIAMDLPGPAWGLSRHAMDAALAHGAAEQGAELHTGVTVTKVGQRPGGVTIHLRSHGQTTQVAARAVVAACGRHSAAGLPPHTRRTGSGRRYVGVKSHYTGVQMPNQVELYAFPGGYAGINPVEDDRANLCLLARYDAFAQAGRTIPAMLNAAARWNPALAARLEGATPVGESACAVAPVDTHRRPEPWAKMATVGDAAAMIPPLCGDGMAMALRSAELCAPLAEAFLAGELDRAGWAERYTAVWQQEFGRRIRVGRFLQDALEVPLVMDGLVAAGKVVPALAGWMVRATRGPVEQQAQG